MSAQIIILPNLRVERPEPSVPMLAIVLPEGDRQRLAKRAREWNLSIEEAAALMLSDALDPRRRR